LIWTQRKARIVASLPCYLADNVDKLRGLGVFDASIKALQWLNNLGYGKDANLILDLVYNPKLICKTLILFLVKGDFSF